MHGCVLGPRLRRARWILQWSPKQLLPQSSVEPITSHWHVFWLFMVPQAYGKYYISLIEMYKGSNAFRAPRPARVGGPSPGARARCLLFCVQSPGPARATIGNCLCTWEPPRPDLAGPIPPPAIRAPGRREWGPSPGARVAGWPLPIICVGRAIFTYTHNCQLFVCTSRRTHTQLPIVYECGSLRGPIPCSVANYLCRSGCLHVHTQLPIVYVCGPSPGPTSI